jgi:hypothetical protein
MFVLGIMGGGAVVFGGVEVFYRTSPNIFEA